MIVGDGVRVLDMPHRVEHKLDAVLAVLPTRWASEGIISVGQVQAFVQMVHGVVVEEDVAVLAVVDAVICYRCG